MIIEKQGNLLDEKADILVHQTNCVGAMGAGIARQIRTQLLTPAEYSKYVQACKTKGFKELLGQTQLLKTVDGRLVANCFGETVPTHDKNDTDYDALMHCINRVKNYAVKNKMSVAIPGLLGCGLAGGDWNIVRKMIYNIFATAPEVSVTICYFSMNEYQKYNRQPAAV
ncbi:Appr-1-p processing domain-containing protein (plasmid) [Butyrivibrio proteoclasticus B316]|uniref:Appr-1-p processing domain-containing protein n=1 Tax=Butyrivibrio proteoclasticus (strain ATCC 51982 / DSM 14932 / B316) TaxID=515622 RepID=E0S3I2_BUTPB|nr:macro domain-containing protein [Butyrivibrio proteoclasticus]ADL35964.1 Appr-1-p processing domain-containing protein [Butyrivibrio proteoclasticus B316]